MVQVMDIFFRSKSHFGKFLRRLSEDFLKNLLMDFMLEDFVGSPRSLLKSYAQNLSQTLEDFSEDSWKTLKRLLEDFLGSLLMYFIREVFRSLLSKVVQKNDVKWISSLYMLRNDI
ncbi:hypothetical protein IGI04_023328 [Brassica rapa subsp. trilocularis]|uniref:Uncharacterized protein n=1 Tax=Brassica rapa subsp. trilocularis TaxID=1813537 RepID=A0ABQ7M4V3_BRACM|nr:hypothetical protein IGI04_023328 [Brassica rapa subsp. trilocularis]